MLVFKDGLRERGKAGCLLRYLHEYRSSSCLRRQVRKDSMHQIKNCKTERSLCHDCLGEKIKIKKNFEAKVIFYSKTGGHVLTPDFDTCFGSTSRKEKIGQCGKLKATVGNRLI